MKFWSLPVSLHPFTLILFKGRPREMVLERSVDYGETWLPWQYYAKDCRDVYGIPASPDIGSDSEAVLCSQMYSDILPYSGGQVMFDVISRLVVVLIITMHRKY